MFRRTHSLRHSWPVLLTIPLLLAAACGSGPAPSVVGQVVSDDAVTADDVVLLHVPIRYVSAGAPWQIRASAACEADRLEAGMKHTSRCADAVVTINSRVDGRTTDTPLRSTQLDYRASQPALAVGDTAQYHFDVTGPDGSTRRVPEKDDFVVTAVDPDAVGGSGLADDLSATAAPVRTVVIPIGSSSARVGAAFHPDGFPDAPSSYDITAAGEIAVADWLKSRVVVFDADGKIVREAPAPNKPVDLALGDDGRAYLAGLGQKGQLYSAPLGGGRLEDLGTLGGVTVRIRSAGGSVHLETNPRTWQVIHGPAEGRSVIGSLPYTASDGSLQLFDLDELRGAGGNRAVLGLAEGLDHPTLIDTGDRHIGDPLIVQPLSGGETLVAFPLWTEEQSAVQVLVLGPDLSVRRQQLLPDASPDLRAGYSGVRWDEKRQMLTVLTEVTSEHLTVQWFQV